jgi:hypothetical protein
MNKQKNWLTIVKKFAPFILIIIFAIIGIIGYSLSNASPPVRILFKSKGGYVIFSHQAHVKDYGLEKCLDCHHNIASPASLNMSSSEWNCSSCHNEASTEYANICEDRAPHRQCIGAKCVECHTSMGLNPKECTFCHKL